MQMAWLLVGGAIIAEITAAVMLRASHGFGKPVPAVFALTAFGTAFYLVSLALVDLPISGMRCSHSQKVRVDLKFLKVIVI